MKARSADVERYCVFHDGVKAGFKTLDYFDDPLSEPQSSRHCINMAKPSHNRDYLSQYQQLALEAMPYHDILAWQYRLITGIQVQ